MKINVERLVSFLNKIKMTKQVELKEVKLDFTEEGLKIRAMDVAQFAMVNALLKKEFFNNYSSIGSIGIGSIKDFITLLQTFENEITISLNENILKISEKNKELEFELIDLQFISEVPTLPEIQYNNNIEFDSNYLNKLISEMSINTNFNLIFDCNKDSKTISIKNNGKYKFTNIYNNDNVIESMKVMFGQPLIGALTNLKSKIILSIAENKPLKIMEKTEESNIVILIAPMDIE